MASLMSLGLLELESLVMTERTHKIRVIQLIIKRAVNTRTKMVEVLATKVRGASVVYILLR
jgi:hypothetical protein